ncbi:MAG: hypothetical protein NT165_03480, partial [Candidatus Falkowbacteria bacterium]|nr:hypothetical protein [Candidatus Falkowbacteria bacterium]
LFSWRHSWIFLLSNLFLTVSLFLGSFEIFRNFKDETLVLHYNIDFGVDWIGTRDLVFWLAGIGVALFLLDFLILLLISKRSDYKFLSFFIFGGLTVCELFLSAALFSVYLVNFR